LFPAIGESHSAFKRLEEMKNKRSAA
jgi:hypothetical protein